MGLRYLWVDALCIIQDAHDDWAQESAQMHKTYGKATLVLVAATSASADETFLHERWASPECALPWASQSSDAGNVSGIVHVGIIDDVSTNPTNFNRSVAFGDGYRQNGLDTLLPERWVSRGWTLQEAFAAPRTLSFEAFEMRWRCLQMNIDESGIVDDLFRSQQSRIDEMLGRNDDFVPSTDGKLSEWSKFGLRWATLTRLAHLIRQRVSVREYDLLLRSLFLQTINELRKRIFTYPSDSLPAIAGIARQMEESLDGRGRYYAGLWSNSLAFGLMWDASHPYWNPKQGAKIIDMPRIYVPSWTWASVIASSYVLSEAKSLQMEEDGSLLTKVQFPNGLGDSQRFVPMSSMPLRFRAPCLFLSSDWMHRTQGLENDVSYFIESDDFSSAESDHLSLVKSDDLSFVVFDYCLRKVYSTGHGLGDICQCEIHQKHRPYPGQHFMAMQLANYTAVLPYTGRFTDPPPGEVHTARATSFLILESVPNMDTPHYRRIMHLQLKEDCVPWSFHGSTMLQRLGDSQGKQVTACDAWHLLKQNPWELADIVLV